MVVYKSQHFLKQFSCQPCIQNVHYGMASRLSLECLQFNNHIILQLFKNLSNKLCTRPSKKHSKCLNQVKQSLIYESPIFKEQLPIGNTPTNPTNYTQALYRHEPLSTHTNLNCYSNKRIFLLICIHIIYFYT